MLRDGARDGKALPIADLMYTAELRGGGLGTDVIAGPLPRECSV